MVKREIFLNAIEDAKTFVQEMSKLDGVVDVVKGSYMVDGCSIMGIFSLDLSKPVTAVLHSDEESVKEKFNKICDKYQG